MEKSEQPATGQGSAAGSGPVVETAAAPAVRVQPRRRWPRRLFWFVLVPCCALIALAIGGYYIMLNRAYSRRDSAIAEARALGEPVWFSELKPAPLPPDEDGTPFLLRAIELHEQVVKTGIVHPYFADDPKAERDRRRLESLFDPEMSPDDLAALDAQLAAESELAELVRQAVAKGRVQLPRDYDAADALFRAEQVGSDQIVAVADVILAQTAVSIRQADSRQTAELLHLLFHLAHLLREEPTLIPHLTRISILRRSVWGLSQALPHVEFEDDQLLLLDADLELVSSGIRMREVVQAERALILSLSDRVTELPDEDDDSAIWLYRHVRTFQLEDQIALFPLMRFDADIADVGSLGLKEQGEAWHQQVESGQPMCLLTNLMSTAVAVAARPAGLNARQLLLHARLALRLDHHKRRTGSLPDSLEPLRGELPSARLAAFPLALRSQLPIVYRRTETGFELYDLGEDQRDSELEPDPAVELDPMARPHADPDEVGTLVEVHYLALSVILPLDASDSSPDRQ